MDTMISVWTVVENVRVASGAAELAIFTALLYWFFTSSRVADMLEVVGERVGGWCGRDTSLRQAVLARRRHHQDMYTKIDYEVATRNSTLYRVKESPVVPAPQPEIRPPVGLACARCAPLSRESWQDPKAVDTGSVINVLDLGRQKYANGGVVSRYLCDLVQCFNLTRFNYKDVVPKVENDEAYLRAVEDSTQEQLWKANKDKKEEDKIQYASVRRRVEAKARKVLRDISSAMSNNVLKFVAWCCHKGIRRIAIGGCGTRAACVERLRRANAAGLPLIFVPLHRSHFDYILVTFALYLTGVRPPLVAAGDNMRIPFFGWFLRGCGAFYIRRRAEGSDNHDEVYKTALRSYILNSLSENNNLEFFIEGGRTRTGKPQPPKAGILSIIMDAYMDGTIDDALLVPVTLNYDRLVDGNFVREQLGMPKQMETFWSALTGIWRTLNTNHGTIRVDFNQPMSLKELVTSFQKYQHFKAPIESPLSPPNNNLAVSLDKQILYNHSHSSLYGAGVSADYKMMVEAIGRHLVYDAAQATALMCTNIVSYVLLTEHRRGCSYKELAASVESRASALRAQGRDLGYSASSAQATKHALEMLGRGLVRREGSGDKQVIRPQLSIAASLELSYYSNTVATHYAPHAILATAMEAIISEPNADPDIVYHSDLMEAALQLSEVLSSEFILCAPCQRIEERLQDAIDSLVEHETISRVQVTSALEEEAWSRRFAARLEDEADGERPDPTRHIKYTLNKTDHALAERRRLILTLRPLLEAYTMTCRRVTTGSQKQVVKQTLDTLTEEYTQNIMIYGEAISTDAIRNCLRLLRQWGVLEMYTEHKERKLRVLPPYDTEESLREVCRHVTRFNVHTPLLNNT